METLAGLFKRYKVKIAYLFGSQKDAGTAFLKSEKYNIEEMSDIDIGVVFEDMPLCIYDVYGELYAELSNIFEPFNVDLVFLNETDILFQYEAITGNLIYCEDECFCDDYEELVMKKASDIAYKKIGFEEDFLEAVRDGYFEITH